MANICSNWAVFTGSKENLQAMYDNVMKAKEKSLDLGSASGSLHYDTYPIALGLDLNEKEEGNPYDEYGSRYFELDIYWENDVVVISGGSAWSPVSEFFRKLSEVYSLDVNSDYDEGGSDIGGYFNCEKGVVTRDEVMSWHQFMYLEHSESFWETLNENISEGLYANTAEVLEQYSEIDFTQYDIKEIESIFNQL